MAIAATWVVSSTAVTSTAGTVYTTAAATAATYGYGRDMVISNSGTVAIFVGLGASNVATTVASMQIPAGGTLLLTQCQIPTSAPVTAVCASGTAYTSIGFASVVSVI